MESLLYMLIVLTTINGEPDVSSRLVEITGIDKGKNIVITQSEWVYLGNEPIKIDYKKDKYGLMVFSFISKEDESRKFVSEEPEELNYIEGEIYEKGKETGSFILRKITGVSVDDPW